MTSVVHVFDVSETLPHDQAFYNEQAGSQRDELLEDAREDAAAAQALPNSPQGLTAGTGEVTAKAGGSNTVSVLRFSKGNIKISKSCARNESPKIAVRPLISLGV